MELITTSAWLKLRICVGSRKSPPCPAMSNNIRLGPRSSPVARQSPVPLNYFGNSKSNAFNDILAFDLLRTMVPRDSG
jgi:hypothetical protein